MQDRFFCLPYCRPKSIPIHRSMKMEWSGFLPRFSIVFCSSSTQAPFVSCLIYSCCSSCESQCRRRKCLRCQNPQSSSKSNLGTVEMNCLKHFGLSNHLYSTLTCDNGGNKPLWQIMTRPIRQSIRSAGPIRSEFCMCTVVVDVYIPYEKQQTSYIRVLYSRNPHVSMTIDPCFSILS